MRTTRSGAFSLVELLTTMSTIAVLGAILYPVVSSGKSAANKYAATQSLRQIGMAMATYVADNDETFPVGYYPEGDNMRCWFGLRKTDGTVDLKGGYLFNYTAKHPKDPSHEAKSFYGDRSGFGYNFAGLGSDLMATGSEFAQIETFNPARLSELEDPSKTIAFATSTYYWAPWKGGDGQKYDFGFITPPSSWQGNPTVDFRHGGQEVIDPNKKERTQSGYAIILHADGSVKAYQQSEVTDKLFSRGTPHAGSPSLSEQE